MGTGFQSFRESDGKLQFDSSLMTLTCIGTGKVNTQARTVAGVGNTTPSAALVPVSSATAIVAARGDGFGISRFGVRSINGTLYWVFATDAPIGTSVSYWVFDMTANVAVPEHGFGTQAFREDGSLYFYSELPIMIGAGIINEADAPIGLPGGRTYAAIMQDLAGHNQSTDALYRDGQPVRDGGDVGGRHVWSRKIDGKLTGVRFDGSRASIVSISFDDVIGQTPGPADQPDPPTVYWSAPLTNALLIDVTGI